MWPGYWGEEKWQPGKGTNHHKLPPIAWTTHVAPRAQLKAFPGSSSSQPIGRPRRKQECLVLTTRWSPRATEMCKWIYNEVWLPFTSSKSTQPVTDPQHFLSVQLLSSSSICQDTRFTVLWRPGNFISLPLVKRAKKKRKTNDGTSSTRCCTIGTSQQWEVTTTVWQPGRFQGEALLSGKKDRLRHAHERKP